ncbi:MAG: SusC/RagA family TonB-linked outer membrane protein [Bacteroidetes bacterium]|nr:SusC/RagA family TonB-linked outer membrane protein [Bacteroidota bacterium]
MRKNYSKKYVLLCAFLMMSVMAFAQKGSIKGTVVDETNQPLPGASVSIDGTTIGSVTDANGNYTISNVNAGNYSLTAKFVGYVTSKQTITVGSSIITVNFGLKPQNTSLNEVVVIGYGTVKSKDVTGAVDVISSKDFNQGAITTPEQLIQGKVAGVSITSNSGMPGAGSTITVRGGASINGSNSPLIVLDGVPLSSSGISGAANPLDLINPNDIESYSILKDASASAIYGNRATNGVIIITTKKGQAGKPVINFNTQFSVGTLPKEAPVLSAAQFRSYVNANDTTSAGIYKQFLGNSNTDWQKQIYRTALGTDNNLSISGAVAHNKLPYRVAVGYTDDNGILKNTSMNRYTGSVNLNPSLLKDHLKINFNFLGSEVNNRFANNQNGIISDAVSFNPTVPVTSSDAKYAPYGGYWQWTDNSSQNGLKALAPLNPVGLLNQANDISTVYRAITNLTLDYKIHFFPDLHANVNLAYDGSKGSGSTTIPANAASNYKTVSQNGVLYSGSYSPYNQTLQNKLFEGYLSYNKDIKSIDSHVDAVAGYSIQDFIQNDSNGLFDVNGLYYNSKFSDGTVNLSSGQNYNNYEHLINEYLLTSFYGRVNYNYASKYYLTASVRSDNSTKFAPGTRTGVFPSAALAWKINNEDFLKSSNVISNLKLRVEYGVTGNQEGIGDYDYLSAYSLSNSAAEYAFGNTYYQLYRPGAFYPGRTWETTHQTNIGLDYGFFNERITGSIDYYYNKTKNLLVLINQPAGANFGNQIVGNVGDMENDGVELNITGHIIDTKDIGWTASFNVAFNHNKILNLTAQPNPNFPGIQEGNISGGTGNYIEIDQPGAARNSFYVYQQVYGANGKPIDGVFVDRDGNGIINNQDLYKDHSPDPKQIFGLSSDFRYKKWLVGFVARANLGNYAYNNVAAATGIQRNIMNPLGIINNGSSDVLASGLTGNGSNDLLSDYYIQNASFLRMDNIHIGYNFGQVFNGHGTLRITANVQNAFIITDYKGVDPEFTYTGTTGSGIDNNNYPRPRTYTLGLNLSLK